MLCGTKLPAPMPVHGWSRNARQATCQMSMRPLARSAATRATEYRASSRVAPAPTSTLTVRASGR